MEFTQNWGLTRANTMRDYLEHLAAPSNQTRPAPAIPAIPVDDPKYHVTTQKRPLSAYAKVGDSRC